ncbi:MAG: carbohydrate kinase, partial [Saprospiraceae bacterium]|nr:carbohydrate kinase [Saprospiraceae bacterium]
WDFNKNDYHEWVEKEGLTTKFAPMYHGDELISESNDDRRIPIGVGVHDSSAALIPYLACFKEPFILVSTGTWCISLNPFNNSALNYDELKQDCLCYLSFQGKPVKASRLFAGYEHEHQVKLLAAHFDKSNDHYSSVKLDMKMLTKLHSDDETAVDNNHDFIPMMQESLFAKRELSSFGSFEEAYHQLIIDLMKQQVRSTQMIMQGPAIRKIFVDGGFSRNPIFMHLMAAAFPDIQVFGTSMAQATAVGAAVAIHQYWNKSALPDDLIQLTYHPAEQEVKHF